MSTGISISCINRIKELAEEKKFAEALEILDTQNLEKSINPQFLRISGEIFRENKRYYDSRYILLKAHQMSPQGTRIIFELMQLYLELGYFTLAKKYYEQYKFYSTKDDVQKDYVEYTMKKATEKDIKELAAILIPILERMPEDKWNFEAVLLYDKLGRKDKALEECRYILENFKESSYVQPVIEYIDDKLDVDTYFYRYPKEEQAEDKELFKDLIDKEEKMLEADQLRMYPPEARIMVEAEDKEALDVKPVKEKKPKKKRKRKEKQAVEDAQSEDITLSQKDNASDEAKQSLAKEDEQLEQKQTDTNSDEKASKTDAEVEANQVEEEDKVKQERQEVLDKLLAKKIDTEKVKKSAKNLAKSVKEFDKDKTKKHVKHVADNVKENVKKATDVIGEAVGAKPQEEVLETSLKETTKISEEIVDGIIESVLEPPKKPVGQVVMNEELDALIPESLEAMTAEEIAELEIKKKEIERLELEALEAQLQLEEKKKQKQSSKEESKDTSSVEDKEVPPESKETNISGISSQEDEVSDDIIKISQEYIVHEIKEHEPITSVDSDAFNRLKEQFLADMQEDDKPLDSLGFITVVQSDVDASIEEAMPDEAGMLHQMIDNKEFYSGEDSTKFESNASYENHGFDIEDYDFESYLDLENSEAEEEAVAEEGNDDIEEQMPAIEIIYADEEVIDFEEIVPEATTNTILEKEIPKEQSDNEIVQDEEEPLDNEVVQYMEEQNNNEIIQKEEEHLDNEVVEEMFEEPKMEDFVEESKPLEVNAREEIIEELEKPAPIEESESIIENEKQQADSGVDIRNQMRVSIVLSDYMVRKLLELKESR